MRMPLPLLPALLLLASCTMPAERSARSSHDGAEGLMDFAAAEMVVPPAAPTPAPGSQRPIAPQALIREGSIRLRVPSVDSAVSRIATLAGELGGHTASRLVRADDQRRSGALTVRVPSARFDEAMAAVAAVGRLEYSAVTTTDVGDQLVDLQARLDNARRLETRLIEVLRTRTGSLQDVLAVERELARVREEVERLDAQRTSLGDRVTMSTIAVEMFEPGPVVAFTPAASTIGASFRGAWRNAVAMVAGLIELTGFILPLAVLVALLATGARYWIRRRRLPERTAAEA